MRFLLCCAILKLVLTAAPPAAAAPRAADTHRLAEAAAVFHAAVRRWDGAGLREAAGITAGVRDRAPDWPAAHYWNAVCEFHLALRDADHEDKATRRAAGRRLDRAEAALDRLLELDPSHGEGHALLASVLGLRLAEHPLTAAWRGFRVKRHEKRGQEAAPRNPRVWYLAGCSFYHAPSILGGRDKGLRYFEKADALFREEAGTAAGPLDPRWGHDSCLAFLGRIYEQQGENARAARAYRDALEANPHNRIAAAALSALGNKEDEQ